MTAYTLMYLAKSSVVLPFLYSLFAQRKKDKIITAIFILLCISIVIEVIVEFHIQAGRRASLYLNLYTLLEFVAISWLYTLLLPQWKKVISLLIVLYAAFFVVNSLYVENILRVQDYPLLVESGAVITYSIVHGFHLFRRQEREPSILSYGPFWISLAFITYFLYNSSLFFMANQIFTTLEPAIARMVWNFHNLNYIIRNLLLAIALYHLGTVKKDIAYNKYGIDENWREKMPSNPHL